jgi:L-ascorbate metabolism protein UlaG (beta-lactamase superfamily)
MIIKKKMISIFIIAGCLLVSGTLFIQQKSFGQYPQGKRQERINNSPNFKNGQFVNQTETPLFMPNVSFWDFMLLWFKRHPDTKPNFVLPSVKTDIKKPLLGKTEIIWIGHSSYMIKQDSLNILVDPVFSKHASPVSFTGVTSFPGTLVYSVNDLPAIDYIILTHDHYDHLDYRTIKRFKTSSCKFITALGVGQHLEHWGIDSTRIIELDWWEKATLNNNFIITATPARHFSGRGFKRNRTLWVSFVLELNGKKLFIGGDSGYDKHYIEIGEKYGPFDIAFLENGQYYKYWQYIHESPEQTAQAAIDLKTKVLMPVHWGRFKLSVHPWTEPIERLLTKADSLHINVTTPMIGEPVILDESYPASKWWRR